MYLGLSKTKTTMKTTFRLLVFCIVIFTHSGYAQTLKVATFNCYFLWDGVEPEEGQVNFSHKYSVEAAEKHMKDIASIIKETEADILNLVEVEGLDALNRLNAGFLSAEGYVAYLEKGKDSYTGQDVGLLTKHAPVGNTIARTDIIGISGPISKSVSKNYYAKFEVHGKKIALIGIHFVAIPNNTARLHDRQAQANAIVQLGTQLRTEGYDIIVLGDFNDYDGNDTSLDLNDNRPITSVLEDVRKMNPSTESDDLINPIDKVAKAKRYTAHWDKNRDEQASYPEEYSVIDHVLVSKNLEPFISDVHILNYYNPIGISDHFPVVVTFDFGGGNTDVSSTMHISSLLPNPAGDERQLEMVEITNASRNTVDLANWYLKDSDGKMWSLASFNAIERGVTLEIQRKGMEMTLNNDGDTVYLMNGDIEVDRFSYQNASEGVIFEKH